MKGSRERCRVFSAAVTILGYSTLIHIQEVRGLRLSRPPYLRQMIFLTNVADPSVFSLKWASICRHVVISPQWLVHPLIPVWLWSQPLGLSYWCMIEQIKVVIFHPSDRYQMIHDGWCESADSWGGLLAHFFFFLKNSFTHLSQFNYFRWFLLSHLLHCIHCFGFLFSSGNNLSFVRKNCGIFASLFAFTI